MFGSAHLPYTRTQMNVVNSAVTVPKLTYTTYRNHRDTSGHLSSMARYTKLGAERDQQATKKLGHVHRRQVLSTTERPTTCRSQIFSVQSLGQSSREKYTYFRRYRNFLKTQRSRENLYVKNQIDPCSCFDTIPVCDRQTYRHTDTGP